MKFEKVTFYHLYTIETIILLCEFSKLFFCFQLFALIIAYKQLALTTHTDKNKTADPAMVKYILKKK